MGIEKQRKNFFLRKTNSQAITLRVYISKKKNKQFAQCINNTGYMATHKIAVYSKLYRRRRRTNKRTNDRAATTEPKKMKSFNIFDRVWILSKKKIHCERTRQIICDILMCVSRIAQCQIDTQNKFFSSIVSSRGQMILHIYKCLFFCSLFILLNTRHVPYSVHSHTPNIFKATQNHSCFLLSLKFYKIQYRILFSNSVNKKSIPNEKKTQTVCRTNDMLRCIAKQKRLAIGIDFSSAKTKRHVRELCMW